MKWLSGVPASISAIGMVGILVLVMGFTAQQAPGMSDHNHNSLPHLLGFDRMTTSWPFALGLLFFLTTLGYATFKKSFPFRKKNIGFFLNHFGLWLTIVATTLGSGDLQRLTMDLYEGKVEWRARNEKGELLELPLALQLNAFDIEEYHPKLAIINRNTGEILPSGGEQILQIEPEGTKGKLIDWEVEVSSFLEESGWVASNRFETVNEVGAAPSALVKVKNLKTDQELQGWVSCGSFRYSPTFLDLDDTHSLVMTSPEPKKFSSDVLIYTKNEKKINTIIEVNKPMSLNGWKIYQLSYDDRFGKWSQLSIVELVRDPWLPVVYAGVGLMLAGALYLFWLGREIKA
ncbi:hypothetical protein E1171_16740 [Cytophagales bacterium RKSG123]|nr:hypothetical protein [Xanthovirga aplysinae]